jgi:hypothetical protein
MTSHSKIKAMAGASVEPMPSCKVTLAVKAIAAGAYPDKAGNTVLKFALQFTPLVLNEEGGWEFVRHPQSMLDLFDKAKPTVTLTNVNEPKEKAVNLEFPALKKLKSSLGPKTAKEKISRLWSLALTTTTVKGKNDNPAEAWAALRKRLQLSSTGNPNVWKYKKDGTDDDVKDIIVNQQHDQAVALERERARALARELFAETTLELEPEAIAQAIDQENIKIPTDPRGFAKEKLNIAKTNEASKLFNDWAKDNADSGDKFYVNPPQCEPPTESNTTTNVDNVSADKALKSHAYTTWKNKSNEEADKAEKDAVLKGEDKGIVEPMGDVVARRFYNIQSTPSLARLFILNVDAECDPLTDIPSGTYKLTVSFAFDGPGFLPIATLCRFDAKDMQFWPTTNTQNLQEHGVALIGMCATSGGYRYDMSSLSVQAAAEKAYEAMRPGRDKQDSGLLVIPPDAYQTGGFGLYDRERHRTVAARLKRRDDQNDCKASAVILDAEDLLLGQGVDIGVAVPDGDKGIKTEWHALNNRKVEFEPGDAVLKAIQNILCGGLGTPDRQIIDQAFVSGGLQQRKAPEDEKKKQVVADELIMSWDGGPMGVNCAGTNEQKTDNEDMPFSRVFDLEPADGQGAPPQLRFGWPYRIGMRNQFQGGVAQHLSSAEKIYNDPNKFAAFPHGDGKLPKHYRRYLRHEKVATPHILMTSVEALKTDGIMGFKSAKQAIVRSLAPGEQSVLKERAVPAQTVRVIMPPGIDLGLAVAHGVYDVDPRTDWLDLRIDTNPVNGGFLAAINEVRTALNGQTYINGRSLGARSTTASEPVFSLGNKFRNGKGTPYIPDPMAETYVIALRYYGTAHWVAGGVQTANVFEGSGANKRVLPLHVTVKTAAGSASAMMSKPERKLIDGIPMQAMTISLRPGDDYNVDVWCIPEKVALARNFAVIEMLAAQALVRGRKKGELSDAAKAVSIGLEVLLKLAPQPDLGAIGAAVDKLAATAIGDPNATFVGLAGLEVPPKNLLQAVAELVADRMKTRPVKCFASVAGFRAVHAINKPLIAPMFAPESHERKIMLRRFNRKAVEALSVSSAGNTASPLTRYDDYFKNYDAQDPYLHQNAFDHLIGGEIKIDAESSDSFRILAETVFPRSSMFDDPERRRSIKDRQSGKWPVEPLSPEAAKKLSQKPSLAEFKRDGMHYLPPASIYGFHVGSDGTVTLPKVNVSLMTVSGLRHPRQYSEPGANGLESFNLEDFYGIIDRSGFYKKDVKGQDSTSEVPAALKDAVVKIEHAFPDGKARQIALRLQSISRHSHLFDTAVQESWNGDVLPSKGLDPEQDSISTEPVQYWLPASVRPSMPDVDSPLPKVVLTADPPVLENGVWRSKHTQTHVTRLYLKRGWFSSGEGERLGLVLWPPNLFINPNDKITVSDAADQQNDTVILTNDWYAGDVKKTESRTVMLPDFEDSDLGPGGAFVTRWGGDPTQENLGHISSNFIPPQQFRDQATAPIEVVEMPVGGISERPEDQTFLTVALLTYAPKFDVDREQWFVDVNLVPMAEANPFVRLGLVRYQKHAPRSLQVSEPVVQWSRLLPERTMTVALTWGPKLEIDVTIRGLASEGMELAKSEMPKAIKAYLRPVIVLRLVATEAGLPDYIGGGGLRRRVIREDAISNVALSGLSHIGDDTVWNAKILLDINELSPNSKLSIEAEEIDRMPAATHENEPIPLHGAVAERTNDYQDSGPRFMDVMDLPFGLAQQSTEIREAGE